MEPRGLSEPSTLHQATGISIGAYGRSIGRIPLLTTQEEVDLATVALEGRQTAEGLPRRMAEITAKYRSPSRFPKGVRAELAAAERRIQAGIAAERRLVVHNLRYANWAALHSMRFIQDNDVIRELDRADGGRGRVLALDRFAGHALPLEDRIQAANEGLVRAARMYAPGRARFVTLGSFYVANYVAAAVQGEDFRDGLSAMEDPAVKALTVSKAVTMARVLAAHRKLRRLTGSEPSLAMLADDVEVGIEAVDIRREEAWGMPLASLEELEWRSASADGPTAGQYALEEVVPPAPDVADHLEARLPSAAISAALDELSEREAGVISLRYGLEGGDGLTLAEVGRIYGIGPERVRQVQRAAEFKLGHKLRQSGAEALLKEHVPPGADPAETAARAARVEEMVARREFTRATGWPGSRIELHRERHAARKERRAFPPPIVTPTVRRSTR